MSDCLFCKIAAKKLDATVVYEDNEFLAFKDLYPKAPVHILVIPKKHIHSLAHSQPEDAELLGRLTLKLQDIAHDAGLTSGFRTIVNTGKGGGQEIDHVHYHILGGGKLPGF